MLYDNLVKPAVSVQTDPYAYNVACPAYTAGTVGRINLGKAKPRIQGSQDAMPVYSATQAAPSAYGVQPPAMPVYVTPQPAPVYGMQSPAQPVYGAPQPASPYGTQPTAMPMYGTAQPASPYGMQPPATPMYGYSQPAMPAYGVQQPSVVQPVTPPVQQQFTPQPIAQPAPIPRLAAPELTHCILRGQKTSLGLDYLGCSCVRVSAGWNVKDNRCDIDASVFLIQDDGKVPSDDWFVFYGQPKSPDQSVSIVPAGPNDRQSIRVDLSLLNPAIHKLVFVMTINEAFEQQLNFSMIEDAWLRVLDDRTGKEIISYRLQEFSAGVTSMTLGEMYLHKGEWKFNPVGNGVRQDLAGQCAIYGVHIG